jgi:polar amino acid transport system substrate-binding protein
VISVRKLLWVLGSLLLVVIVVAVGLAVVLGPKAATQTATVAVGPTPTPNLPALLITAQTLTWGGDATLGAPFVSVDPAHPGTVVGLDVDIVTAIATRLHLKPQFKQIAWSAFPRALHSRSIDLFADGLIPSELPKGVAIYTAPTFLTSDEIVVRAGDTRFATLQSLEHHQVGIVTGDRAAGDVTADKAITAVPFTGQLPFEALATGLIDAVVISAPLARWFGTLDPLHRFTVLAVDLRPAPVAMALAISHTQSFALRDLISQTLHSMRCDGSLEKILAKWGLTSRLQQWFAIPVAGSC